MIKQILTILLVLAFVSLCLTRSPASAEVILFQKPTVNRTHIVFSDAGDLWGVAREGGDALPLSFPVYQRGT